MFENNEDVIRDEYKEAVTWIRVIWGFRLTSISIALAVLGLLLSRSPHPEILFVILPLFVFIDFTCLYAILPFVYSSIYIEQYYLPKAHHIVTNWNNWQGIPTSELITKDDDSRSRDNFRKRYTLLIYRKKIPFYIALAILISLAYFVLLWTLPPEALSKCITQQ